MTSYRSLICLAALTFGCSVAEAPLSIKAGDGIHVASGSGEVSIDKTSVPFLESCDSGNVVSRTDSGWACMPAGTPSGTLATIQAASPLVGGGPLTAGGVVTLGLTPGPAGSVIANTGDGWRPTSVAALGVAGATTADATLYVRPDGSDSNCDGSTNAAATAAPGCAFASPQRAIDALPPIIKHAITISLATGTYSGQQGQAAVLNIQKLFLSPTANITLGGTGAITFSAASPSIPTAIAISGGGIGPRGTSFVTLQNITVTGGSEAGIEVRDTTASFSGVTVQNAANVGLRCDLHAFCTASGALNATNNTHHGIEVENGATLYIKPSATLTVSGSGWTGLAVSYNSALRSEGTLRATNNGDNGVAILQQSNADISGDMTVTGNATDAFSVVSQSQAFISGAVTVSSPAGKSGVVVMRQSSLYWGGSRNGTITCTGRSGSGGIFVWFGSSAEVLTSGNVTISGCDNGIWEAFNASFTSSQSSRTLTGVATAALIAHSSYYQSGGFPLSQNCITGSGCE